VKLFIIILIAILAIGLLLFGIPGCEPTDFQKRNEIAKQKLINPVIAEVATNIEGCKVSYVDRGQDTNSFYLAKCEGASATTTQNYLYHYGKGNTIAKRRTTIELSAEIDSLTKEREETKKLESALSKLSEDDKEILGLIKKK